MIINLSQFPQHQEGETCRAHPKTPEGETDGMTEQATGRKENSSPDEYRCVEQAYDWSDIDAHQHPVVDILQAQTAILHLSVGFIIVQNQLHLQQTCETLTHVKSQCIKCTVRNPA